MSMSAEEATKKYQELNTTIEKTQKILNSLNKSGYQSSYFTKIGEWDKQTNSFKKNTKEIEKLVSQYNKIKEKNKDRSNFKSDKEYNASIKKANTLKGRISSIVTSQKKHKTNRTNRNEMHKMFNLSPFFDPTFIDRTANQPIIPEFRNICHGSLDFYIYCIPQFSICHFSFHSHSADPNEVP